MLHSNRSDTIKLALPKGKLIEATACFFNEINLGFENYNPDTRTYRLQSKQLKNLSAKMFHEKDIPIQVAVGNYDLGICGLDWIEELLGKYPASPLVKIENLEYDKANIYLATSKYGDMLRLKELTARENNLRIVTEYPNLAEVAALNLRLKYFSIFPVWGAVEAYPPEDAELIVLRAYNEQEIKKMGLLPVKKVLVSSVFLIGNRESLQNKNVSRIISLFSKGSLKKNKPWKRIKPKSSIYSNGFHPEQSKKTLRLALPDGHQQTPAIAFLEKVGLKLAGYAGDKLPDRRPTLNMDWIEVKVIRPQDMPMQVANGNFDLAVTGKDWWFDHIYRFPSSPVTQLVELGFGAVRVVAVVHQDIPADNIEELIKLMQSGKLFPLRVASEYINIADKFLRDNHVSRYKLIPTWGASEAFLPEDADLLIENTQTGKTLATNKLKIIDTLFHSTACLVANKKSLCSAVKKEKISYLEKLLRKAAS